jgi:aldehyde:ferredoxin oxidoreductase
MKSISYRNYGSSIKIDLSTGEVRKESYDENFAKKFLGGNGLATKLIYDTVPADISPDDPRNALAFTTGPLTDTPVWGTSRGHVATISPHTNLFADSNYGGNFAIDQKRTGFDAIHITGQSSKPVYLPVQVSRYRGRIDSLKLISFSGSSESSTLL